MRVIGLDVGERRTGLASGDTETGLAIPVGFMERTSDTADIAAILLEAASREATVIVVGMPYSMSGSIGPQAQAIAQFIEVLRAATTLEVETIDERLSTIEANRRMRSSRTPHRRQHRFPRGASDAAAAAVILQSWLDSQPDSQGSLGR